MADKDYLIVNTNSPDALGFDMCLTNIGSSGSKPSMGFVEGDSTDYPESGDDRHWMVEDEPDDEWWHGMCDKNNGSGRVPAAGNAAGDAYADIQRRTAATGKELPFMGCCSPSRP